jgi:hypothetical protein
MPPVSICESDHEWKRSQGCSIRQHLLISHRGINVDHGIDVDQHSKPSANTVYDTYMYIYVDTINTWLNIEITHE